MHDGGELRRQCYGDASSADDVQIIAVLSTYGRRQFSCLCGPAGALIYRLQSDATAACRVGRFSGYLVRVIRSALSQTLTAPALGALL